MNFLFLIFFINFFSIFVLCIIPRYYVNILKTIALALSLLIFFVSIFLCFKFDYISSNFQSTFSLHQIETSFFRFDYGVDGVSLYLVILNAFLFPICILASWNSVNKNCKEFFILFFIIEFFLFNAFAVLDLFLFYIFFESILSPMFIVIGVWGSRTRKIHAAYQFFFYTFAGSIFMLFALIYIYINLGSVNYFTLLKIEFEIEVQHILWAAFFLSFAVKIPIIPIHIWLPEAHVEAPTAGSVLLAGILLKLGTYGFIRFSIPLLSQSSQFYIPIIFTISIIGILYASLTTLRQIDLKKIIAYSSVAHINFATIGLFSSSLAGVEGGIALILSHGLVSSALFLCVGVLYDRYGTRIIRYYSGLTNFIPIFATFFIIFSIANIGFPGTSAFVGEFGILLGVFGTNSFAAFVALLGVVFSAGYSMWLYNRVIYGPCSPYVKNFFDLNRREFLIFTILSFIVIIFGIRSDYVIESIHSSSTNLNLFTQIYL